MLERLLQQKMLPSPLILEGENFKEWLKKIIFHVFCEERIACHTCRSCKKVQKGFHPDWLYLEEPFKVEDVREALIRLRQKPFEAKVRVLSISNLLSTNKFSQNALLKILEEPFPSWVILLGVRSRFQLLDTVRSRCLVYRIQQAPPLIPLNPQEEALYQSIQEKKELKIFSEIDPFLKNRESTKELFQKLLMKASQEKYPAYWNDVAPDMMEGIELLSRNLNQKLIWDRILVQTTVL